MFPVDLTDPSLSEIYVKVAPYNSTVHFLSIGLPSYVSFQYFINII